MDQPGYESFASKRWRGWTLPEWRPQFVDVDPLAYLEQCPNKAVVARQSARVLRVSTPNGSVYLKHLTAANERDAQGRNWVARARWLLRSSRASRTLDVVSRLRQKGISTPQVVLAARRHHGYWAEDLIVSEEVQGENLRLLLRSRPAPAQLDALITLAGQRVAELHKAGFIHGDLIPGNLLVTPDNEDLVFLDNDRTWSVRRGGAKRHQMKNLEQFVYRLRKYGAVVMKRFIRAYAQAVDWTPADITSAERTLITQALARAQQRSSGSPSDDAWPEQPVATSGTGP